MMDSFFDQVCLEAQCSNEVWTTPLIHTPQPCLDHGFRLEDLQNAAAVKTRIEPESPKDP
jgi:hypothetical protein